MDAVSSPDATRRIRLVVTAGLAVAAISVAAILVQPQPVTVPPGPDHPVAAAASAVPSPSPSQTASPPPSRPAMTIEVNPPSLGAPATPALTKDGRPIVLSCFDLGFPAGTPSGLPPATWAAGSANATAYPHNGLIVGVRGRHVMTLDPRSGKLMAVADLASGLYGGAAWSPTGAALMITAATGFGLDGCSSVDVLSRNHLVRVAVGRGGPDAHWAPDGMSVAVLGQHNSTYRADGTLGTPLPACGVDCFFDTMRWSPDGRHVVARRVYNDEHADIVVITVKTGEAQVLPGSKGLGLDGWFDDRNVLLDARSSSGRARWVADRLDDGTRTPVHLAIDASTVARLVLEPSPDFRSAAGSQCIWCPFIVLHGGVPRIVWKGHPPMDQAWSPDSQWIAFAVRGSKATRGVWIVRADGTHRHRISQRILDGMDWGVAPG